MLKVFSLESLHQRASIEFRLEASNAFNHPTFGQPATDVDDPLFGLFTYSCKASRQGQFGAKVTFQVTFARSRRVEVGGKEGLPDLRDFALTSTEVNQ